MTIATTDQFPYPTSPKTTDQLERFLDEFQKKHNIGDSESIFSTTRKLSNDHRNMHAAIAVHQEKVRSYPIIAILSYWLESIAQDPTWGVYYREGMRKIIDRGLLSLIRGRRYRLIGEFCSHEHLETLENIRCVKEWSIFEKDRLVSCYLQFSRALSEYTFNLIPAAYDPDRERSSAKSLEYNTFVEFIQHLSPRDVLISKLLYFGAHSIEEVLDLRVSDINFNASVVTFASGPVRFQKHIILDLHEYVQPKKGDRELVFVNAKGKRVSRTHLINAFARVFSKQQGKVKITPSTLFKPKSEE